MSDPNVTANTEESFDEATVLQWVGEVLATIGDNEVSDGNLAPDQVKISDQLEGDLGIDSLSMMELVVCLEDEYEVRIDTVTPGPILTIGDVIARLRPMEGR